MNEFIEFFESKGIKNIKNLAAFVHKFFQEPAVFFDLTEAERNEMDQKFDEVPIPVIPATQSGRSRPPVPEEVGRLFRLKPATDSGAKRPPIGAKRRWF